MEKINEVLFYESNNLQDAILSSLTNLNILTTFTPEEMDMTQWEIEADIEKEKKVINEFIATKGKMDKWLPIMNENTTVENFKEQLLQECPWLKNKIG